MQQLPDFLGHLGDFMSPAATFILMVAVLIIALRD